MLRKMQHSISIQFMITSTMMVIMVDPCPAMNQNSTRCYGDNCIGRTPLWCKVLSMCIGSAVSVPSTQKPRNAGVGDVSAGLRQQKTKVALPTDPAKQVEEYIKAQLIAEAEGLKGQCAELPGLQRGFVMFCVALYLQTPLGFYLDSTRILLGFHSDSTRIPLPVLFFGFPV